MFRKTLLTLALFGAAAISHANVLTTIKPLGFIANAITDGVTETRVLLPMSASPHDYNLKPSDVEKLKSAQLIVWIGDQMETFLEKSIENLPKEKVLTLDDIDGIKQIVENAEKSEPHEHQDGHHHDHGEDWHIWLSPQASELIAETIAQRLSQQMPEQKTKIAENLADFKLSLTAKHRDIQQQLGKFKTQGYYTFHDAYGHFETAYGLHSLGAFTLNPTIAPGAKTLNAIKMQIRKHQAKCLFAEPQFTPKVIESLSRNTAVHIGKLDPLGEKIPMSKTAYPQFLQSLADQFSECLSK